MSEPTKYTIEPHKTSRFFAVRDGGELVVVTTYRKGAEALVERLKAADHHAEQLSRMLRDGQQRTT